MILLVKFIFMLRICTRQNRSSTDDQRTFIEYPSDM